MREGERGREREGEREGGRERERWIRTVVDLRVGLATVNQLYVN